MQHRFGGCLLRFSASWPKAVRRSANIGRQGKVALADYSRAIGSRRNLPARKEFRSGAEKRARVAKNICAIRAEGFRMARASNCRASQRPCRKQIRGAGLCRARRQITQRAATEV